MTTQTYKRLAAIRPADQAENEMYVVPASMQVVGVLRVANQTASEVDVSVAHTDTSGAAGSEDWMLYELPLPANLSVTLRPVSLNAGETIRVKTGTADAVSFVLSGLLIDNS